MVFSRLKVEILFSWLCVKPYIFAGVKKTLMLFHREGPIFAGIE